VLRYQLQYYVRWVVSVCCQSGRVLMNGSGHAGLSRMNGRTGTTGLLYPFNDDSFLVPGINQRDGDLKFEDGVGGL
jgi:hypothetical protein